MRIRSAAAPHLQARRLPSSLNQSYNPIQDAGGGSEGELISRLEGYSGAGYT